MAARAQLHVVFAMLAEGGHYAGTFGLARQLARRGHRVSYLGLADSRPLVAAQGFDFLPFAAALLPAGSLAALAAARAQAGGWRRLLRRRSDERRFAAFRRQIVDGPLDELLRRARPDVVVCDTFVWYVALRALAAGLPVVGLSIVLSLRSNWAVPPITTSLAPRATWWMPLAVRAAWLALRLRFLFSKRLASVVFGRFRAPTRMHHLVGVFRSIARRSRYALRENRTWWFGEMGPRLALDEIVLCPRAFQLPDGPDDRRVYLGELVDLERREEPLEPAALDPRKPLVYCSLGSSPSFYPDAERFFAAVAEFARRRPDWQVVLHTGDRPPSGSVVAPPASLLVRARVPQLALLRCAAAMVTHGGMNSIQECIHFGVPMVIVPALRDQPGNAVRAARLGIALTAKMSTLDAALLAELIDRAATDATMRDNLTRLRAEIAAEGGMAKAVERIEAAAERPARC